MFNKMNTPSMEKLKNMRGPMNGDSMRRASKSKSPNSTRVREKNDWVRFRYASSDVPKASVKAWEDPNSTTAVMKENPDTLPAAFPRVPNRIFSLGMNSRYLNTFTHVRNALLDTRTHKHNATSPNNKP